MAERPATTVPCVFYKDPIGVVRWLEQAFGCETTTVLTDANGKVGHAEMSFHDAPVAIGGGWSGPQLGGARMTSPSSLGGAGAQFIRIELDDNLDAHCAHARAAGARITDEPADRAMDPEGHIGNFGEAVRVVSGAEMEAASRLKVHTSLEGV